MAKLTVRAERISGSQTCSRITVDPQVIPLEPYFAVPALNITHKVANPSATN